MIKTIRENPFAAGLLPLLLLSFLILTFRNSGIYPIIFIDEWIYASATRMMPLSEALVPSYLYFKLYGLTSYCGDGYLECNKLLNNLLYVGAAPFIWLLARRAAPAWAAGLVALAAIMAPANVQTPFFMPEAAYFFAFWVICWSAMRVYDQATPARAAELGALIGLTAMVKLHAIFLLPAACVFLAYLAYAGRDSERRWLLQTLRLCGAMLATGAVLRFGIGYLLAGRNGLHLLGKLYADSASYTARSHLPYAQLAGLALNNLRGQMMMLAILFGVPLAALAASLAVTVRSGVRRDPVQALGVLAILMLGSALGVTVLFTASITGLGEMETAQRIHTRYYNFALPLLLICAAAAMRKEGRQLPLAWRAALAVLLLALIAHGWHDMLRLFTPNITDSPEMRALSINPWIFGAMCTLAALMTAAWLAWPVWGIRVFVALFLPLSTIVLGNVTAQQVRMAIWPDDYSKAGLFVRHYLARSQTSHLTIVADDIAGLHRARFFIENPEVDFMQIQRGKDVDWDKLAPGRTWALVVGNYTLPDDARIVARKDNFALIQTGMRAVAGQQLSFKSILPGEFVLSTDGLAGAEDWGTWSEGPSVRIQFSKPLPRRMAVHLAARAFGPNAGQDFILKIGSSQQAFRLGEKQSNAVVEIESPEVADTLELLVPAPTSPQALGVNNDRRLLGIGIESMKIMALP